MREAERRRVESKHIKQDLSYGFNLREASLVASLFWHLFRPVAERSNMKWLNKVPLALSWQSQPIKKNKKTFKWFLEDRQMHDKQGFFLSCLQLV